MYVTKDKKLCVNTDLVQTASLNSDESVTLSLGANAVTLHGEDAAACAKQFGLADDKSAQPSAQPVKK